MERELAIKIVKQILESCGSCQSVTLILDSSNNKEVTCVQLNSSLNNDYYGLTIEKIAKKNGLLVDHKGGIFKVYK